MNQNIHLVETSAEVETLDIDTPLFGTNVVRAFTSGVPSREETQSQIDVLASPVLLKSDVESSPLCPAISPLSYTEEHHAASVQESLQNVEELQLRLQRLKLWVLRYPLRAAHYVEEPTEASSKWYNNFEWKKYWSYAFGLKRRTEILDPDVRHKLVAGLNSLMPEEYWIEDNIYLNGHDAELFAGLAGVMGWYSHGEIADKDIVEKAEAILLKIKQVRQGLHSTTSRPLLFSQSEEDSHFEEIAKESWNQYRVLLKEVSALQESTSWFSPTYAASIKGQCGLDQSSIPFKTDYQRWKMEEVKDLERILHNNIFRPTEYGEYGESFLVGSGTAALNSIFETITREIKYRDNRIDPLPATSVLKTDDIYFEVDGNIETYARNHRLEVTSVNPADVKAICRAIRDTLPVAVFLNPMSNMYDMKVTQVGTVLRALASESFHNSIKERMRNAHGYSRGTIYVVIDNSTLGQLAKWKEFDFSRLPDYINVISFESLIKYSQDGLDHSSGGLVTLLGRYAGSEYEKLRRFIGAMPTETTTRRLGHCSDGGALKRKMKIHSRNTKLLIESLLDEGTDGFINEIVHPFHRKPENSRNIASKEMESHGGMFHLGLDAGAIRSDEYLHRYVDSSYTKKEIDYHRLTDRASDLGKSFAKLVLHLAKLAHVNIHEGTGYGFQTTRIAVYSKNMKDPNSEKGYKLPYLRVLPGTESTREMILIASVLRRANAIFSEALREGRLLDLADRISAHSFSVEPA